MRQERFEEICAPYSALVYRHCLQMLRNPSDAEDAAQETMLRAFRSFGSFSGEAPGGWLFRIAHNLCLDRLRSQARGPVQENLDELKEAGLEPADPSPAPDAAYVRSARQEELHRAILRLPEEQQVLLALFYSEHLSYEEIAARERLRTGTVKSRLNRAKEALRKLLPEDE